MKTCIRCPIRDCTIFSQVERGPLNLLEKEKTGRAYKKRSILFREGEVAEGVHCLYKGRVRVFQMGKQNKKHVIAICQPGDLLGLVGVMNPGTYRVTAEATEEAETCFIPKPALFSTMKLSDTFLHNILKELAGSVNRVVTTFGEQRQVPVRERIARTLIALTESRLPQTDSTKSSILKLSRTDIASFSGTVLESAVRCLSEFKKEGLIKISGQEIQILNLSLLKRLATQSR